MEKERANKISFTMLLFNSNKWVAKHDIFHIFSGPTDLSKNNLSLNSVSEKSTTAGGDVKSADIVYLLWKCFQLLAKLSG